MNLATTIEIYAQHKLEDRTVFQGLHVSIENRAGSVRKGKCEKGKPHTCWVQKMHHDYGYLTHGVLGVDGDKLDVFIGSNPNSKTAFVVHTLKAPAFKDYDEDKVFLGWDSKKQVKKDFVANYGGDARHFGSIDAIPMDEFKRRVLDKDAEPQKLEAIGEPGVYEGGMAHIEPTTSFHPPSLKKPKRVPTDDPRETDNKFLDVSKRKSKATKKFRDERTRRVAIPTELPGGPTAVQHHTGVVMPFTTGG